MCLKPKPKQTSKIKNKNISNISDHNNYDELNSPFINSGNIITLSDVSANNKIPQQISQTNMALKTNKLAL